MPRRARRRFWRDVTSIDPEQTREFHRRNKEFMTEYVMENYRGLSLEQIAAKEGITIRDVGPRWSILGQYRDSYYGQPRVITLAKNLSPEQRQETLAHELGHYFLHHADRMVTDGQGHYGRKWAIPRNEQEPEADEFGKFLMSLSKV